MAANLENGDPGMGLVQLKYARRGKKAAVTNRIKDLERIMSEGGRRTVVRLLRDGLLTVFWRTTRGMYENFCLWGGG